MACWFLSCSCLYSAVLLVLTTTVLADRSSAHRKPAVENGSFVPAFFVFGDSTVDSGNNNYINTPFKSDFPPYGKDFPSHVPTGRFTNGRLVTDFILSYALGKGKYVPAYLDPKLTLEDMITGVCFASALSGLDSLTARIGGVISMEKQLEYFKEYKERLEKSMGEERSKSLISKAVFVISAGTNDFIFNYYGVVPIRRHTCTVSNYQHFLVRRGLQFLLGLMEVGAMNIAFVGLPPMGCVPLAITLFPNNASSRRGCVESLSTQARDYNRILQVKIATLQKKNPAAKIVYADIYTPLDDVIKNPRRFGFDRVNKGCCGSGLVEASFLCNPHSALCSDETKYVFWDSVHPTEAMYYKIFDYVRPIIDLFLK